MGSLSIPKGVCAAKATEGAVSVLFPSPFTAATVTTSPRRGVSSISATPWSEELNAPGWQKAQGMASVKLPFLCRASECQGQGEQQPALLPVHQASPSQLTASSC